MTEPKTFNGDPGETGRFASTGPRREEPATVDYYGRPCHRCGKPCHRIYTLADVGIFCSAGCRQQATEPRETQGAA